MEPTGPRGDGAVVLHASCVDVDGHGILISGASGRGKSVMALQLMALGARLVADDRTQITASKDGLTATVPATIRGLIEARGVGLLNAVPCERTRIHLVIDMDQSETERLPHLHRTKILNQEVPTLYRIDAAHFPAAILQLVRHGRRDIP